MLISTACGNSSLRIIEDTNMPSYQIPTFYCFPCDNSGSIKESWNAHASGQSCTYATACAIYYFITWNYVWNDGRSCCRFNVRAAYVTIGVTVRWLQSLSVTSAIGSERWLTPSAGLRYLLRSRPSNAQAEQTSGATLRLLLAPLRQRLLQPRTQPPRREYCFQAIPDQESWKEIKLAGMMGMCLTIQVLDQT